jgi:AcrR family transcriptional regulator
MPGGIHQGGHGSRGRPRDPAIDTALLKATLRVLATSGIAATSMDRVAAEAGVSKVTLYARYRSKSELIGAALEHLQIGDLPDLTGDLEDDLVALLAAMRRQYVKVDGMNIVGTCLTAEGHEAGYLDTVRTSTLWPRRTTFSRVLERGIARGELDPETDVQLTISLLIGAFYADYLAGRPMAEDWDCGVVRAVLAGLRTGPEQIPRADS